MIFRQNFSTLEITDPLANIRVKTKQTQSLNATGTIYDYNDVNATNRYNTELSTEINYEINDPNFMKTTVDFTIFKKDIEFESITIDFLNSTGENPICVHWDEIELIWRDDGCKLIKHQNENTTCECEHLTNFGLLFGYRSIECGDQGTKDKLSNILGGLSIALLIFTQIFLHLGK